ncbi:MAG: imidazole glycerol phosphate synthase subunit HisH [Chloroflexota bacterium]
MIAILDYGVGNLRSVYKAFETVATPLSIPVDIVDTPTDLTRWRAVVLPGQGAFGDSVDNLRNQQLDQPLLDAVQAGLPLLGICVGMQLLFDESEEMGQHEGLHIIPGQVRRFPKDMADAAHSGRTLRIPQIGWNQLHHAKPSMHAGQTSPHLQACSTGNSTVNNVVVEEQSAIDELLLEIRDGAYAYFAHSYYCDASSPHAVLTYTDYGIDYPSIVRYKNAWGIQCHPEKSHTVGLQILKNFMQMVTKE